MEFGYAGGWFSKVSLKSFDFFSIFIFCLFALRVRFSSLAYNNAEFLSIGLNIKQTLGMKNINLMQNKIYFGYEC